MNSTIRFLNSLMWPWAAGPRSLMIEMEPMFATTTLAISPANRGLKNR